MATVDQTTADKVASGKFKSDRIVRIVRYENQFDGAFAYGLETAEEIGRYENSPACRNPQVYWELSQGYKSCNS
jgi:hypothetical protein